MMSTSTQSPRLGYPVGSGSSAAPTLWDTGDTASPGGPPRLEDGAGGSNASGPQADPIDLTSTGDGGGLERTLSVDEVLDQLSSAPRDAHCLAMLDELASLGGLTLKQQVRLVGLYRQVSTACDGKAADLSARLFECHGKTEGDRRALVDWIARATSSTHGDAARLTQVGQARQATPELKQSMDAGGTSLQGAAALVGETKNLSSQAASQVIGTVIGQGPGRNPAELRQAARVQVEQAHQDTAVERHAKAMRQRHVSVTPAADGMSWLRAYVASTDATVVSSALARQARSQPAAGRSLANVEADLLVDYLHQAIDQADQTGRTSTGKPVGQASRVKPVGQASQAEPAGQASQVQPDRKAVGFRLGEPARPVSPGSKPAAPVKPAGSPQPGERVGPVAPVGPPQVIGPAAQAGQAPPVDPVDQAQLAETVASADAAGPAGPVTTIARQIRPGGVRRATARNARLLVMVEADALDATKTVAGPRQAPGSENLGRSIATSTSRLLVKMGPARLDPAHSPGAGHRAPPKGADPPKLRGESQTVDMRLPVDASPPDGVLAGLMVGTGSVVTGPDLDGLVALANRQAMVVDPATGRLVALGARPSRPSSNLVIPEVTWAWDDPSTWPAERAWSDGRLPSGWLALMLMVRDQTCRWPGCTVPATDCQFDHLEPFSLFRDAGAQTWAGNLVCVCLMHHRLRHDQGWAGRRDPTTGQTFWSGPHGQTLARPPERFD